MSKEFATFGGGCFWCLDPIFADLDGVLSVTVGYAGGEVDNPTYQAVCSGTTGHAEVLQVEFDNEVISYLRIMEVFFQTHNPTTLNRQGADVGTQYRSIILTHSEDQREIAEALIKEIDASDLWDAPVVTEISEISRFYPAEEYHQDYYKKNPFAGYCQMVIRPKIEKFNRLKQDLT